MIILNTVADLVRYTLSALPPSPAFGLFIPVLIIAVFSGAIFAVRKLLVPVGRILAIGLRWLTIATAALVLVPEAGIASSFRRASRRPPAAVYNLGDAVAISVTTLMAAFERLPGPLVRLSRISAFVIFVAVCLWIWWWNQALCPTTAHLSTCVRPLAAWWAHIGGK